MPNWKKVITSGSNASLTSVTATAGFTGSLQGTAASASSILPSTVTGIVPVPFMSTKTLGVAAYLGGDNTLTYDTSTGTLNASRFSGTTFTGTTFNGNATTATTAATASTISITATDGTAATFYPVFVDGQTGARISRTDVGLTYNSLTNALSVTGGSISTTTVNATNINGTSSYALKGGIGYTIFGQMTTALTSPADSSTYYGGHAASAALTATAGARKMYVPKTGFVRDAQIFVFNVAGSSELSTFWLVKNDATSSSIGTANHNVSSILVSNYALNMSVTQGDYLEFKWVTPAWVVNPTSFTCAGHVLIEEV